MNIIRKGQLNTCNIREKVISDTSVTYITFDNLEQTGIIRQGFSTRLGGVSEGEFASMNLSFSRNDDPQAVMENYRRFTAIMDCTPDDVAASHQTHTTNVCRVSSADKGKGVTRDKDYSDIDGLITDESGVLLACFFADCVPLYFVDPVKKVIGLSHSGWRGTVGKIGKVTVEKMEEEFGCDPADILGAVGPSICQDCYEVSEDVIKKFRENYDENLWPEIFYQKENGKYQLNLWKANESVFLESGILPEHIAVTNVCTHCNPDILFSHRTTGNERGTLSAFLALKK